VLGGEPRPEPLAGARRIPHGRSFSAPNVPVPLALPLCAQAACPFECRPGVSLVSGAASLEGANGGRRITGPSRAEGRGRRPSSPLRAGSTDTGVQRVRNARKGEIEAPCAALERARAGVGQAGGIVFDRKPARTGRRAAEGTPLRHGPNARRCDRAPARAGDVPPAEAPVAVGASRPASMRPAHRPNARAPGSSRGRGGAPSCAMPGRCRGGDRWRSWPAARAVRCRGHGRRRIADSPARRAQRVGAPSLRANSDGISSATVLAGRVVLDVGRKHYPRG